MNNDHLTRTRRRRGAPPAGQRLTRDDVINRAAELIAADGLSAFSLRGLADALGVAPSAIYNHIGSREQLLDAVAQGVVAEIRLPAGEQPWPDWTRAVAAALRSQLLERQGLADLVLARAGSTAAGPGLLAGFLDRLQSAGVDRAVAHVAWHTVLTVVVGSMQQDGSRSPDGDETFEAVLDVTVMGLVAAAAQPPSRRASALLEAHRLGKP
jgi:AcrR family transcriptional regulator